MYARLHPTRWISSETEVFCSNTIYIKNLHYFSFLLGVYKTPYHYYTVDYRLL